MIPKTRVQVPLLTLLYIISVHCCLEKEFLEVHVHHKVYRQFVVHEHHEKRRGPQTVKIFLEKNPLLVKKRVFPRLDRLMVRQRIAKP